MPDNKDRMTTYDWCWECCAYHKNGEKECQRKRPFRGNDGSVEDRDYQQEVKLRGDVSTSK